MFNKWNGVTMIMSSLVFMLIAVYMVAEYDVIITEANAASNVTEIQRNATGHIMSNTTIYNPATNTTTIVIDSTQSGIGWLYMASGLIFFVIFIWRGFL
jgi:hypothetical protein